MKEKGKELEAMNYWKYCMAFIREQVRSFHRFSRHILCGTVQLTGVLYLAAGVTYRIAPYVPDAFRAWTYSDAFLSVAPVALASGVIAALISDLVLRKSDSEKKDH